MTSSWRSWTTRRSSSGLRKVIVWCLEWAIARNPELADARAPLAVRVDTTPSVFACRRDDVDESGGVADELSPAGES